MAALRTVGHWPADSLVIRTADLGRACDAIGKVYCPYRFDAKVTGPGHVTEMRRMVGTSVGISRFSYGAAIDIQPEPFSDFLLVLSTVRGAAEISTASDVQTGGTGMTVVTSADTRWRFRYSEDNEQLVVRLSTSRIADIAASLTGSVGPAQPQFRPDMADPGVRHRWMSQLSHLVELLGPDTPISTRSMLLPRAEEMLIATLLLEQSASVMESIRSTSTEATPAPVRRAIDYIQERLDQSLTMENISAAAKCSARTLHRAFREHRQISVMQYVKSQRMQRVRHELMSGIDITSVTDVALKWGFSHLGQFAVDYRALFGEKPSDTLRKR